MFIFLFFCQLSTVVKLLDSTNLTRKIRSLFNLSLLQDITTITDGIPPILNTLSNSTKAPKVFLGFPVRLIRIPTKKSLTYLKSTTVEGGFMRDDLHSLFVTLSTGVVTFSVCGSWKKVETVVVIHIFQTPPHSFANNLFLHCVRNTRCWVMTSLYIYIGM